MTTEPTEPTEPKEPLLKLYIYDYCPFCVRTRMIFGLKEIEHQLVFVANHDEATLIDLVGAKQTPILQLPSGKAFPESLDIVKYVDENYGGPVLLQPSSGREDLQEWFANIGKYLYPLVFPRNVAAPFAEFAQRKSREYYQSKKEKMFGPFSDFVKRTPELIEGMEEALEELEELIYSEKSVNPEGVGYDDIMLFGSLRGLTIVRDLKWPPTVRAYINHFSEVADIPLLTAMATF